MTVKQNLCYHFYVLCTRTQRKIEQNYSNVHFDDTADVQEGRSPPRQSTVKLKELSQPSTLSVKMNLSASDPLSATFRQRRKTNHAHWCLTTGVEWSKRASLATMCHEPSSRRSLAVNRAVARGGQEGQCPHYESLLLPPRQFSKPSKSRRSVRENAMVFSHMAILTSKTFTSDQTDHLSHVLISIFIVFLLRTDRILCVCVCVCVCCAVY